MPFVLLALLLTLSPFANAQLKIATTTTDLQALVNAVGGDQVETFAVAKGTQDPHQIEAKPSFMVKFRGARLVVAHGLDLESAWLLPLIQGSRNPEVRAGTPGFLELGPLLHPLDVLKGPASRAQGDVHPDGNPHFHLDPVCMGEAAVIVAKRLGELQPAAADQFRARALQYQKQMLEKEKLWKARIEKTSVKEFASYHRTLSYFADRFGLQNTLHLEPKPGIPPTAGHLLSLTKEMKARSVKIVLIENFYDDSARAKLENEVPGLKVIKVPVSVLGEAQVRTNEDVIEGLVKAIESAGNSK